MDISKQFTDRRIDGKQPFKEPVIQESIYFEQLRIKVLKLALTVGQRIDKCTLAMDLSIVVNEEQQKNLLNMIAFMEKQGHGPLEIFANVMHDLNGLRGVYHGDKGFSPRSSAYKDKN